MVARRHEIVAARKTRSIVSRAQKYQSRIVQCNSGAGILFPVDWNGNVQPFQVPTPPDRSRHVSRKKRNPPEDRKPVDYREAVEDSLELAKALAGQGGIGDQDFLERMACSDDFFKLWQEEQKAGRDPHPAFKDRGWEP